MVQASEVQIASFLLLILTVYLGIQTQVFQRRTSVRESIEQLDEHTFDRSQIKLKPILHEFRYRGPWSRTVIEIRWRTFNQQGPAGISGPQKAILYWLTPSDRDDFCRALENIPGVASAHWEERARQGLLRVSLETGDAVTARRLTEQILETIDVARENRP